MSNDSGRITERQSASSRTSAQADQYRTRYPSSDLCHL